MKENWEAIKSLDLSKLNGKKSTIISSKKALEDISPMYDLQDKLLGLGIVAMVDERKSEIIMLQDNSSSHRKILEEYSVDLIDKMLTIVNPSILMAYSLYTFSSTQSKTMMFTIPFVLYGIFRYEYLMDKKNIGGKPEDIFGRDLPFLINIVLWIISILLIIYLKL